jgi:hypothetical protein
MADFIAAKEVELGPHHLACLQMFHPTAQDLVTAKGLCSGLPRRSNCAASRDYDVSSLQCHQFRECEPQFPTSRPAQRPACFQVSTQRNSGSVLELESESELRCTWPTRAEHSTRGASWAAEIGCEGIVLNARNLG